MVRIAMLGSEWCSSRSGGLNRYFEDLAVTLSGCDSIDVQAAATGVRPVGVVGPTLKEGTGLADRLLRFHWAAWRLRSADILDVHFAAYGGCLFFLPWLKAVKVMHFHGPWAGESRVSGQGRLICALKKAFEVRIYRRAHLVIVLSSAFRDLLVRDYGVAAERIRVVPPGVDLQRFRYARSDRARSDTVICVRRLEARMGIDRLLLAWVAVLRELPGAKLVIVGVGSQEAGLRKMSRDLGLSTSVDFRGRISDEELASAYASATCSVVPSLTLEGFGLIALESLASGVPPIVTDCGGLPSAVEDLDTTLIVAAGNTAALARRIVDCLQGTRPTPDACRAHAERFSWSESASRHLEDYASHADRR